LKLGVVLLVVAAALAFARSASASCAVSVSGTPLRPAAHVIFDGVLLDGPNDTPFEHFQVIRYVKSDRSAQRVEAVVTGCQTFTSLELAGQTSLSIDARPGEVWRIYAGRRADGALGRRTRVADRRGWRCRRRRRSLRRHRPSSRRRVASTACADASRSSRRSPGDLKRSQQPTPAP